jgi:hypothetical protein
MLVSYGHDAYLMAQQVSLKIVSVKFPKVADPPATHFICEWTESSVFVCEWRKKL